MFDLGTICGHLELNTRKKNEIFYVKKLNPKKALNEKTKKRRRRRARMPVVQQESTRTQSNISFTTKKNKKSEVELR